MISCTEFIPLYSELFKYLEELGGKAEVEKYWEYISEKYTSAFLGSEVEKYGLRGCWNYWSKSLNEEACDFEMGLDEKKGKFFINMKRCPSKGKLLEIEHIEPYHDYCGHCPALYTPQLKKFGIEADVMDFSKVSEAACYLSYKTSEKKEDGEVLHMDRRASDNEYFHPDFHISAKRGVEYVGNKFGDDAVTEYLTRFAKVYYAPLIALVKKNGFSEMKAYIEETYVAEKKAENVSCMLSENELYVKVSECPGVMHIKERGFEPSKWYKNLTETVYGVVAKEAGVDFEMISYDEENGAAEYRFSK